MRWLVCGGQGMLGSDLSTRAAASGAEVVSVDRDEIDITDADACDRIVRGFEVVVNCAAWTAVDEAETHEAEAFAVNAVGAANLARAASRSQARLVQISTDYVFDGAARHEPYSVDEPIRPESAYGRTKAAGEWAVRATDPRHLVVRTAWLYGAGGANFAATMARLGRERGAVAVVADQCGQPTWTVDLGDLIVRLIAARVPGGTYHGTAAGQTTWYGFAQEVMSAIGLDPQIVSPITSSDLGRAAKRPAYSVLDHSALLQRGIDPIGPWLDRWQVAAPSIVPPALPGTEHALS